MPPGGGVPRTLKQEPAGIITPDCHFMQRAQHFCKPGQSGGYGGRKIPSSFGPTSYAFLERSQRALCEQIGKESEIGLFWRLRQNLAFFGPMSGLGVALWGGGYGWCPPWQIFSGLLKVPAWTCMVVCWVWVAVRVCVVLLVAKRKIIQWSWIKFGNKNSARAMSFRLTKLKLIKQEVVHNHPSYEKQSEKTQRNEMVLVVKVSFWPGLEDFGNKIKQWQWQTIEPAHRLLLIHQCLPPSGFHGREILGGEEERGNTWATCIWNIWRL